MKVIQKIMKATKVRTRHSVVNEYQVQSDDSEREEGCYEQLERDDGDLEEE